MRWRSWGWGSSWCSAIARVAPSRLPSSTWTMATRFRAPSGNWANGTRPAVMKAKDMPGDRLANAISANVTLGVQTLTSLEPIVGPAVSRGQVKIVGAVYDLRTGAVALTG